MVIEKKLQRERKGGTKTAIRSAKKKSGRLMTKRHVLLCVSLLFILVCAIVLLIHVIGKRGGSTPPSPYTPDAAGPPIGGEEMSLRIATLNEGITKALLDLGMSSDSLAEHTETPQDDGDIEYTRIAERYVIPEGVRAQKLKEYLSGRASDYPGVLTVKSREDSGGLEMTVYAYGMPIRDLAFTSGVPPTVPPPRVLPKVAIIIDDMGANRNFVGDLLALKYPITFSVFAHLDYSVETANRVYKKGREVMLHLPMEPIDYPTYNPGPGALFTFMTDEEFLGTLENDLAGVPHISGVNNHMGSLLTQDRVRMEIVMREIKKRGLFFVDSKTGPRSVAYEVAVNLGVPAVGRDVFLDNEADAEKIKARIAELIGKAKKNGRALGICHPRPETIRALKEMEQELSGSEVEMVRVKDLLK